MTHLFHRWAFVISFMTLGASSAQAITNSTATSNFAAVGELNGGASGVLIAKNWVLTAAHVIGGLPSEMTFSSFAGSSVADAFYVLPSIGAPENDLALVHLASGIQTDMPILYDTILPEGAIWPSSGISTVTMVSPQNQTPSGMAQATAKQVQSTYTNTNTGITYTTNWLITRGTSYVEGGDSGSALFKGTATDTANSVLLGIASSELTDIFGNHFSAYTLVGNYKTWIDSTMAPSGQQAQWVSSVVPEPNSLWLMALGLTAVLLMSGRWRQHVIPVLRYRHALAAFRPFTPFTWFTHKTDGDSMVPRSHERDQKSHHRTAQAH